MRAQRIVLLAVLASAALTMSLFVTSRTGRSKPGPDEGTSASRSSSAPEAAFSAEVPPIRVQVKRLAPASGRVEYHYTVLNGSTFPVSALLVGFDEYYGVPTLASYPVGWDGDTIPSSSYQAPPGWIFNVQPTEEESLITVKWERSTQGRAIMGGESLGGFMVVLSRADSTYDRGGMWTAYVTGNPPLYGALQREK